MVSSKSKVSPTAASTEADVAHLEVRCSVRFPIALPVVLNVPGGDVSSVTRNISASGVLFEMDRKLKAGTEMGFSLRMPSKVLGTPNDVMVHCAGRVVRCSLSHHQFLAAATIDEYRFAQQ